MRARRLALLVIAGCAARARPPEAAEHVSVPTPPARAPWRALVAQSLPSPLRALAAKDAQRAAVVADDRAYLLRGDAVIPLCEDATRAGDLILAALPMEGATVVVGTRDRAVALWRALDEGGCSPLRAPPLETSDPAGTLGAAAHDRRIWLWSPAGWVFESTDAGESWRRLPTLPRVTRVFAGPGGEVWATSASGHPGNPRDAAAHRGRIVRLMMEPSPTWRAVAEDRLLPVATSSQRGGPWLVADGLDLSTARPGEPLTRERWLPWGRTRMDAPSEIVDAGEGRFFASAGRMLFRVDGAGVQPMGLLPGGGTPLALSAAVDGALWAMDANTLWQAGSDGSWTDRSRRPWSSAGVAAVRMRGEAAAVATEDGRISVRDRATGRWSSQDLPPGVGRVLALEINDQGTVLALCERGGVMGDGRGLSAVDAPTERGGLDETPSVHAIGDRWVVLRGGVWTTDDEGATWSRRLAPPIAGEAARPISQLAVVGGRALALDEEFGLWRSDDGAASWRRVSAQPPWPGAEPPRWNSGRPLLAWDGRERVVVLARNVLAVSDDLGQHWSARGVNALATALTVRVDGAVFLATGRSGSGSSACEGASGIALLSGDGGELGLVDEACEHVGDAVHLDGERGVVLSVRRDGSAWVGELSALSSRDSPRIY